jgi:hypothetical protein
MEPEGFGGLLAAFVGVFGVLGGVLFERHSQAKQSAIERCEARNQRWREQRQGLLTRLQDRAFSLSNGAATAFSLNMRPELNEGKPVDRNDPWFVRMLDDQMAVHNLTDLIGDQELERRVRAFVTHVNEVRSLRSAPDGVRAVIVSLEEPLNGVTEYASHLYRELEGVEPRCGDLGLPSSRERWSCQLRGLNPETGRERWTCNRL